MTLNFPSSLFFLFLILIFGTSPLSAQSQLRSPLAGEPEKITLCQLSTDPAKYDQKLVEVVGFVSRAFEDSTLFDPSCTSRYGIWLEVGGKGGTGTIYCCGTAPQTKREKDVVVEGMSIQLMEDDNYRQFSKMLTQRSDLEGDTNGRVVYATLVGRFFSGRENRYPGGRSWGGYGHMGCCSLFVVQQVVSVKKNYVRGLDYSSSGSSPDTDKEGCGNYTILKTDVPAVQIENQRRADNGMDYWRLNDPIRVATTKLRELLNIKEATDVRLEATFTSPSRITYFWRPKPKKGVRYMIEVSRPYWLSFYATKPDKTIWVASSAYSICN